MAKNIHIKSQQNAFFNSYVTCGKNDNLNEHSNYKSSLNLLEFMELLLLSTVLVWSGTYVDQSLNGGLLDGARYQHSSNAVNMD